MAGWHSALSHRLFVAALGALLVAPTWGEARANSRNTAGAVAAGAAIGILLGAAAASQASQSPSPGQRAVPNCAAIHGRGAVNAPNNPHMCVCRAGFVQAGQRCVAKSGDPAPSAARASTDQGGASRRPAQSRTEIEGIQEALNLLGYDAGTVDGSMGQKSKQAILKFQADRQLPQTGHLSVAEQQLLLREVDARRVAEAKKQQAGTPSGAMPPGEILERSTKLPSDPAKELAHWESVKNSKIPEELEDYLARFPKGEFTRLAQLRLDALKTELSKLEEQKSASVGRHAAPMPIVGPQLPPLDDAAWPKAKRKRSDAVAVIIGNQSYRDPVPKVEYGIRDAEAMKLMVIKTLGLDEKNVIVRTDASRAALDEVFGSRNDHKGRLWQAIDPDGRSDIYIFYSGHGVPAVNGSGERYLLPVDGDANHASLNGYPLSQLFDNLDQLKAKSVTVFLDACFSGQSPDPNATPLISHASPVFSSRAAFKAPDKINVFSAATDRQLASWDASAGHGLFTRWVLAGLAGEADEDKNREVSTKELSEFVRRHVARAARKDHRREQEPTFTGDTNVVLSSF